MALFTRLAGILCLFVAAWLVLIGSYALLTTASGSADGSWSDSAVGEGTLIAVGFGGLGVIATGVGAACLALATLVERTAPQPAPQRQWDPSVR